MRAMARAADGQATLVEMKAVDAAYPLFGQAGLDPPSALADALALRDGAFGAVADATLMSRLDLKPGARLAIGSASFEIRATLANEPDKLAGGIGFGPRLLVSQQALRATGLLQPGSLVRWHYRLRLPTNDATDAAAKAVTADARNQLPEAGWDIRSRSNASPQLERNVERFTQFLTIVGLTALLVGGVGVGNAVKSHLDRRRDTIATMKALGASGRRIFDIYLTQVLLLALIGAGIGVTCGALLPFLVNWTFGAKLGDMLSGYRVMSRRFVKSFPALSPGFEIETELTVHALDIGASVEEMPTAYKERPEGSASKLNSVRDGMRIMRLIARLVRDQRPIEFFSLATFVLLAAAAVMGLPVVFEFLDTGLVPRQPTWLAAVSLVILAFLSFACGLILDGTSRNRREARRLAYLAQPVFWA